VKRNLAKLRPSVYLYFIPRLQREFLDGWKEAGWIEVQFCNRGDGPPRLVRGSPEGRDVLWDLQRQAGTILLPRSGLWVRIRKGTKFQMRGGIVPLKTEIIWCSPGEKARGRRAWALAQRDL
jgi:hypothetical protein